MQMICKQLNLVNIIYIRGIYIYILNYKSHKRDFIKTSTVCFAFSAHQEVILIQIEFILFKKIQLKNFDSSTPGYFCIVSDGAGLLGAYGSVSSSADVISAPTVPNPKFHESANLKIETPFLSKIDLVSKNCVLCYAALKFIEIGFLKFINVCTLKCLYCCLVCKNKQINI